MPSARDESPWQDHPGAPDREELLAPSTQIVADRETYLGQGRHDVGRRISDDQVELFSSTDVASALEIEFSQHSPLFLALHDVGTSASLRLLTSVAAATQGRVHRLSVRRQGHGMALAVIQFVEVLLADGTPVRAYSTDINGDPVMRASVARVLLAHSRLGVMLVGALAAPALATQLQPLHDAVLGGHWPNRELLMVPLGSGVALAAHAAQLAERSKVAVHVTPHAGRTGQAWAYIGGAWNRLHGGHAGEHAIQTELAPPAASPPPAPAVTASEEITQAMPLQSHQRSAPPAPAAPAPATPAGANPWQAYVDSCAVLKGAVAGCVFDTRSMHALAHAGSLATATALAEQGTRLLRSMSEATRAFGLSSGPTDGTVSAAGHHLVLRPVPGHPGIALHLVLASSTNLTLAKMQLERIVPPPPPGRSSS